MNKKKRSAPNWREPHRSSHDYTNPLTERVHFETVEPVRAIPFDWRNKPSDGELLASDLLTVLKSARPSAVRIRTSFSTILHALPDQCGPTVFSAPLKRHIPFSKEYSKQSVVVVLRSVSGFGSGTLSGSWSRCWSWVVGRGCDLR